jgi:hypothetical protein
MVERDWRTGCRKIEGRNGGKRRGKWAKGMVKGWRSLLRGNDGKRGESREVIVEKIEKS